MYIANFIERKSVRTTLIKKGNWVIRIRETPYSLRIDHDKRCDITIAFKSSFDGIRFVHRRECKSLKDAYWEALIYCAEKCHQIVDYKVY